MANSLQLTLQFVIIFVVPHHEFDALVVVIGARDIDTYSQLFNQKIELVIVRIITIKVQGQNRLGIISFGWFNLKFAHFSTGRKPSR